MEQILLGFYVFMGLLIGWFYTVQMIKRDFGRNKHLDSLAVEMALMIVWWVFYTAAGMFWPFMVLWWVLKKAKMMFERVDD